jgi:hypothetical protein
MWTHGNLLARLWTTPLTDLSGALNFRLSPEGPEAKLVTAITSRSTPREGSFGFLLASGSVT